ncbi:MAG: hypothetical protein MRY79_07280 [Alphaproteobacteria bacterium]|nr:hypothetical protein [Alphaproteobacteria bacterium]
MSQKQLSIRDLWVNAALDPVVHLNLGTVVMTAPVDYRAALINAGRAALAFGVRLTSEFERSARPLPYAPSLFRKFAQNKGATLITNGIVASVAAYFAFEGMGEGASFRDYFVPLSVSCFAASSFTMGVSESLKEAWKNARASGNALGVSLSCIGGCFAMAPGTPVYVYGAFLATAAMATYLGFKQQPSSGWKQPDLMASASYIGSSVSAFFNKDIALGIANLQYAFGFKSLDDFKKHGGAVQAWRVNPLRKFF